VGRVRIASVESMWAPRRPAAPVFLALLCLSCAEQARWESAWLASQAAWAEHDDAERALGLLEAAFSQRPPADAEEKMLRELVALLENVRDEQRVVSALESVQASLFARHGFTSHAALTLSAALAGAKASMQDTNGALRHASTVRA